MWYLILPIFSLELSQANGVLNIARTLVLQSNYFTAVQPTNTDENNFLLYSSVISITGLDIFQPAFTFTKSHTASGLTLSYTVFSLNNVRQTHTINVLISAFNNPAIQADIFDQNLLQSLQSTVSLTKLNKPKINARTSTFICAFSGNISVPGDIGVGVITINLQTTAITFNFLNQNNKILRVSLGYVILQINVLKPYQTFLMLSQTFVNKSLGTYTGPALNSSFTTNYALGLSKFVAPITGRIKILFSITINRVVFTNSQSFIYKQSQTNIAFFKRWTCNTQKYRIASCTCVNACLSNQFQANSYCFICRTFCVTCSSQFVCTSCVSFGYLQAGLCQCVQQFFEANSNCSPCPSLCTTCSTSILCLGCMREARLVNNMCLCQPSYYDQLGNCVKCPINCLDCSGRNICSSCQAGFVLKLSACKACHSACLTCRNESFDNCQSCSKGYVLVNTFCVQFYSTVITIQLNKIQICGGSPLMQAFILRQTQIRCLDCFFQDRPTADGNCTSHELTVNSVPQQFDVTVESMVNLTAGFGTRRSQESFFSVISPTTVFPYFTCVQQDNTLICYFKITGHEIAIIQEQDLILLVDQKMQKITLQKNNSILKISTEIAKSSNKSQIKLSFKSYDSLRLESKIILNKLDFFETKTLIKMSQGQVKVLKILQSNAEDVILALNLIVSTLALLGFLDIFGILLKQIAFISLLFVMKIDLPINFYKALVTLDQVSNFFVPIPLIEALHNNFSKDQSETMIFVISIAMVFIGHALVQLIKGLIIRNVKQYNMKKYIGRPRFEPSTIYPFLITSMLLTKNLFNIRFSVLVFQSGIIICCFWFFLIFYFCLIFKRKSTPRYRLRMLCEALSAFVFGMLSAMPVQAVTFCGFCIAYNLIKLLLTSLDSHLKGHLKAIALAETAIYLWLMLLVLICQYPFSMEKYFQLGILMLVVMALFMVVNTVSLGFTAHAYYTQIKHIAEKKNCYLNLAKSGMIIRLQFMGTLDYRVI